MARYDLGISDDEAIWDLAPAEFLALNKRHIAAKKDALFGFRFMATVFERSQGRDVNYMEDQQEAESKGDSGLLEVWLKSRSAKQPEGIDG